MTFKRIKIQEFERGLHFYGQTLLGVLEPGVHWIITLRNERVDVVSVRKPWIDHAMLDVIVKSGLLREEATVLDVADHERALVWIDGRFAAVHAPGLYALWNAFSTVKVEIVDARSVKFMHELMPDILTRAASSVVYVAKVEVGHVGLYFYEGVHRETLGPGRHVFWNGVGDVRVQTVDLREAMIDVSGQEIITADKVSLRMNSVVTYRVTDALKAVTRVGDHVQALYRDAQLVLREIVGTRELDALLADKEAVAAELSKMLASRAEMLGLEIVAVGIRDIILPGEMRTLLNKVTEARKAAEAALITRREETAAMRSQANTAKILENSPTLMRLRELEVLEKVAGDSNLSVILGDGGLVERVSKLL